MYAFLYVEIMIWKKDVWKHNHIWSQTSSVQPQNSDPDIGTSTSYDTSSKIQILHVECLNVPLEPTCSQVGSWDTLMMRK